MGAAIVRTAYLTFSYPAISQTFVVGEVQALRARGFTVHTWGINAADPAGLLTDAYRSEARSTRTLRPVARSRLARAHLRAVAGHPRAYLGTLAAALRDRSPGLRALALALAAFGVAVGLKADLEREDIRHLHVHFAGSPTHVAWLVCRLGNAAGKAGRWSWSVTVHGPVEFADATGTLLPRRVADALFVVAISDFARSQLLAWLPPEQWHKVRVVRCGVRPAEFAPAELDPDSGRPLRLLYVGRLVALKAQPVLIEAVAALRDRDTDVHLTLVGDGPERGALEDQVRRAGLEDRVTFAGALGQDDVREHYRRADVFCLPSFAEGVPMVLMEAMASGLAVVSTRIAGVPELVDHGHDGLLVRPGRADELTDALERLAGDPGLRASLGAAARGKVEREYDLDANAARLADLHLEFRRASP